MNLKYLESLRLREMESILDVLKIVKPARAKVLEIGAGTGWQSKILTENGYTVEAIDIIDSNYCDDRVWSIANYDGRRIPFPDRQFDIVFSSNVLEHIPHVVEFQDEIQRVLKPDGISLQAIPSGSWRFWTNVTYYWYVLTKLLAFVVRRSEPPTDHRCIGAEARVIRVEHPPTVIPKKRGMLAALLPARHGEIGNAVSELYYFSNYRWANLFRKTNWTIEREFSNRLFYTGYSILGPKLSLKARANLSYVLGSSCNIFVLRSERRGKAT